MGALLISLDAAWAAEVTLEAASDFMSYFVKIPLPSVPLEL